MGGVIVRMRILTGIQDSQSDNKRGGKKHFLMHLNFFLITFNQPDKNNFAQKFPLKFTASWASSLDQSYQTVDSNHSVVQSEMLLH